MQKSFLRETAGVLMRAAVVVLTIVVVIMSISTLSDVDTGISDGSCNIAILPVEGTILPFHGLADFDMIVTPEGIEAFMATAENDKKIDAVLLEINSPGGTPVASERIARRFKDSPLPVVGVIGDIGASGGYMVAAATDFLIASPMSSIGSIGVSMSYLEESQKNEEEGITYVQLTTGKYKDTGSPNRPITDEERELLERDLLIIHNEFIDIVAEFRNLDRTKVEIIADGATMPGERALENNLIDSLGGRPEATGVLATILEKDPRDIVYCEYERGFLPF